METAPCHALSSLTLDSRKWSREYSWLSTLTAQLYSKLRSLFSGKSNSTLGQADRRAEPWASFTKEHYMVVEPDARESEGQLDFVTIKPVATNFEAILNT